MHIERFEDKNQTVVYPNVAQDSEFDLNTTSSVIITVGNKSITLTHKRLTTNGSMQLVQFSAMSKSEMQNYINELILALNSMEG